MKTKQALSRKLLQIVITLVLVGSSCLVARPVFAAMTFTVTSTNDSGVGSLRQAILDANSNSGIDTIAFSIGSGPITISIASSLPSITEQVTLDGTTQPGFIDDPIVELSGSGSSYDGITITGGNSTVRGLVLNGFTRAIVLSASSGNRIEGNFIGTDKTGTVAKGNLWGVVIDRAPNNIIGGLSWSQTNLISGSYYSGVFINGPESTGNVVENNLIGTDISGTVALKNAGGVVISDASNNSIGTTSPGSGNLISGNDTGITIQGWRTLSNSILRNAIGTDTYGTSALPNRYAGVSIQGASNNYIGAPGDFGNLISGNGTHGVEISSSTASGNLVQGNFIGVDATGEYPLGNLGSGVYVAAGAGGTMIGAGE